MPDATPLAKKTRRLIGEWVGIPTVDQESTVEKIIDEALAEEREACAKFFEESLSIYWGKDEIADAIRARKEE